MSKEHKQQDHFRYKRLGTRWRKPRGLQSKLRRLMKGAGKPPSIGERTARRERNMINGAAFKRVHSVHELEQGVACFIGSSVGARQTLAIADAASKQNVRILNMNKVKQARKRAAAIAKAREGRSKKPGDKPASPMAPKTAPLEETR